MDLYFEVTGNGHPVVLVHSGGADSRLWTFLAPLLSEDYKVIAFDGRGAGKSPSPVTEANYVEDLLALMDDHELNQATIVGHSMGGQIATEFALSYPEKVSKLVLLAPSLTGFPYSEEFVQYHIEVSKAAPDIDKMLEVALHSPTYQVVNNSQNKDLNAQMLKHHFERMLKWPSDFHITWPHPPAIEKLGELKPETLFFIGDQDLPDNYRVADYFGKVVPNIRFSEMTNADHMLPLTHSEDLYREIIAFMED